MLYGLGCNLCHWKGEAVLMGWQPRFVSMFTPYTFRVSDYCYLPIPAPVSAWRWWWNQTEELGRHELSLCSKVEELRPQMGTSLCGVEKTYLLDHCMEWQAAWNESLTLTVKERNSHCQRSKNSMDIWTAWRDDPYSRSYFALEYS